MPEIDASICKGCNLCVEFCPKKVFAASKKQNASGYYVPAVRKPAACTGCGLCELLCPDFALSATKKGAARSKDAKREG
jgi:2-oxoglutarate ferredoxin oxidoreductase subunit delta